MSITIAIDGYESNTSHRVGIGEYAYEILSGMYDILQKRSVNQTNVNVYLPDLPLTDLPVATSFWEYRLRRPKKMWTYLALPKSLLIDRPRPDVVFSPTHYVPRFIHLPRVMAIMDLSFLHYPTLFRKKDYYQLVNWTKYSVHHARHIVTISEFSKNAIIESYQVPESRVTVTYPGFHMRKMSQESSSSIKKRYQLNNPFVLAVGTLQPRKNFTKLIEAFSLIKQDKHYQDLDLVIVGKKGWLYEEILSAPSQFHIRESVKFLDFVPDADLAPLYSEAECFVLPSLYEGFGLPVLEAMANGCSVVVSNVSSLPEIAGDAGIYVDPTRVETIRSGIHQALQEKGTAVGNARIKKGKERVGLFRWDKAAEQTLTILEQIGKGEL